MEPLPSCTCVCKPCAAWAVTLVMPSPNTTGCLAILQWSPCWRTDYSFPVPRYSGSEGNPRVKWRESHSTLELKDLTQVLTLLTLVPEVRNLKETGREGLNWIHVRQRWSNDELRHDNESSSVIQFLEFLDYLLKNNSPTWNSFSNY
jgi:hypothetical protein